MEDKKATVEKPTIILLDETKFTEVLHRVLDERYPKIHHLAGRVEKPGPLEEYIPKSEVRGKILSASTLWKHEKRGKLKTYAIGGKRYYKRSEIENLIQEVKQ